MTIVNISFDVTSTKSTQTINIQNTVNNFIVEMPPKGPKFDPIGTVKRLQESISAVRDVLQYYAAPPFAMAAAMIGSTPNALTMIAIWTLAATLAALSPTD
ncbi:hypothetical protein EII12_09355 [Buchananella hordeovulneris]|uniref:hypothetical protein n=1 Tax=Buchananella hordeovulneris TaxID=52770 RepID=UPI000F5EE53D|nr:hypothetical protein [Buchananella hordeovulneris]RRD50494.1 hypothetical protein EII12_09355 [Buchananella hordeovulneris]